MGYAVRAMIYEPERSFSFALQPVPIIFQDNVCHDLAVNKATQPSKYYGAGQSAKVRSRAAEGPAEDEAAPGLPVPEGRFIGIPPPSSALPKR